MRPRVERGAARGHASVRRVGKNDVTAFCEAVWRHDAKTLAALGPRVDPNAPDRWKRSPLLMAAEFGDLALVTLLVERGGDVDQNRQHLTPVTLAARRRDLAMVRFLRDRGATMSAVTWVYLHDRQQLELALARDSAAARLRDEMGTPILHHAAEALAPDLVVLLLERGASVSDQDENGETALHRVADMRPREPEAAARMATLLLDRGADPNAGRQGWSPLHQIAWTRKYPIQHGLPPPVPTGNLSSLELARKLLEHGANVDARMTKEPADGARNVLDRIGSTPSLQASKLADVPYMRVLLEHGADPSIATEEGATALMAAAGVGIWQVGESAGTNEEAFEAVKLCYDVGNDVNAIDKNGDTALHGAAHRGANDIVKFLVEKGAKLNVVDKLGWTPWIIADGVFYPNTYNRRLDTAELLLKLGADPKVGKRRPEDLAPSDELQHTAPASKSRQQQH